MRLQGVPLGQRQEGASGRICLSLRGGAGGGGAQITSEEQERGGGGRALGGGEGTGGPRWVLLPGPQVLQDPVHLVFFAESLKERQQVQELCVIHVVEPGLDRDLGTGREAAAQSGSTAATRQTHPHPKATPVHLRTSWPAFLGKS